MGALWGSGERAEEGVRGTSGHGQPDGPEGVHADDGEHEAQQEHEGGDVGEGRQAVQHRLEEDVHVLREADQAEHPQDPQHAEDAEEAEVDLGAELRHHDPRDGEEHQEEVELIPVVREVPEVRGGGGRTVV